MTILTNHELWFDDFCFSSLQNDQILQVLGLERGNDGVRAGHVGCHVAQLVGEGHSRSPKIPKVCGLKADDSRQLNSSCLVCPLLVFTGSSEAHVRKLPAQWALA